MDSIKTKKNPDKKKVRPHAPRNRRKTSGFPVSDIIRSIGSGMLKVFLFLSVLSVISLTFVLLYNYLLTSPYMKLENVEIHGVDEGMKDELLQLCGLTSEQGLLSLKLESMRKEIEKHPWVKAATVERKFPHSLIVHVEKEDPVILVLLDQLFYMNGQGQLFTPVLPDEEVDFPILTGLRGTETDQRKKLKQTVHVLNVLEEEEGQWSIQNLSEMHLNKNGGISLYFNHIQAAINISLENPGPHMEGLKQVTKHLSKSGKINLVTRIDLNHVDGAVVSFKRNQV
ncbi:MAG: FtsQ-type POTRA domain-containing protein [Deltaproteobacteria bacterium]|nr:FtsQ-type POTRA domain-containing protein [Deltaproteobacteria bacterium]